MASSSAPNHDFAPAWLRLPTTVQRPTGESLTRRDGAPTLLSAVSASSKSASSKNSLSQEQRRDRGRAAFPFRHHSIDADDLQHHHHQPSASGINGDYRLHAGQRQQSGSQPVLSSGGTGARRPLSRQDFRDGSKGFSGGYEQHNGNSDHQYRSDAHWGRQRSFDRAGRGGPTSSSDLSSGSSRGNGGGGGGGGGGRSGGAGSGATASKWKEDTIDKFDKEFPSLKGDSVDTAGAAVTSVSSVWVLDKNKGGKIHLSAGAGKRLHLVKKAVRNDTTTEMTATAAVKQSSITSPGGSTTTVTNNGSTSVYRTLGSTKGPILRRPSKDSGKLNGLPNKSVPPPLAPSSMTIPTSIPSPSYTSTSTAVSISSATTDVLNACRFVTHPKSLLLAANKSDFLRELRDEVPAADSANVVAPDECCNGHAGDLFNDEDVCGAGGDAAGTADSTTTPPGGRPGLDAEVVANGIDCQPSRSREVPERGQFAAMNGIGIRGAAASVDQPGNEILSRSLEAEQRLLREMGWKEEGSEDEDVYAPLTEDEMKEFESLSKQIPKRNGFQRNVQFTWSPKRMLTMPSALHLESGGSSSSTSSDSD